MSAYEFFKDYGCSDGGCVFGHPGGMHTNGGCKCLDTRGNEENRRRAMKGVRSLLDRIDTLESDNARLREVVGRKRNDEEVSWYRECLKVEAENARLTAALAEAVALLSGATAHPQVKMGWDARADAFLAAHADAATSRKEGA